MIDPEGSAPLFRRVVLGLHDPTCAQPDLEAAIALARDLESELLAVFVEDRPVLEWSAAPLSRHMSATSGTARPVTAGGLSAALAGSASRMQARLMRAAHSLDMPAGFHVERAGTAGRPLPSTHRQDLLAVIEPADPLARLSYPFAGILRAIAATPSPVLYVPHGSRRRQGPVVAFGPGAAGEVQRIAAAIAARLGAPLVSRGGRPNAGPPAGSQDLTLQALDRALAGIDECLLVLDRPALPAGAAGLLAEIAARRAVPVLVAGAGRVRPGGEAGGNPAEGGGQAGR